ncbi:hypothetical protein DOM21_18750 [Bacteriovorax stolpii]|uniref:Uncharacterized protein n=1 Tax=Bacteriovorax stolpii TaxID=960 RepID=A0A2K9NM96_BACTC|nr:hypothetical protein [Bacteriovorax stolpii]AUN96612.1 hypothetical protein C0V70_00520 [Bacteriovorax stolpii]QDK43456.1 hypothetical protein DOM21_18750 [Bacteriovorax stolpii]TDP53866.1 hypothetical protein C8D79_1144 [Bacteriovorax stolpii]
MINALFENIQQHLSMLDLALLSSQKIASMARTEDLDGVVSETDNRERLVNIIAKLQHSIEEQINQLNASEVSNDDIAILKSWFQDLSIWSERMIELDKETVEILSQQKENTTKEIAHIFKNKEMFKGYNHSSKK